VSTTHTHVRAHHAHTKREHIHHAHTHTKRAHAQDTRAKTPRTHSVRRAHRSRGHKQLRYPLCTEPTRITLIEHSPASSLIHASVSLFIHPYSYVHMHLFPNLYASIFPYSHACVFPDSYARTRAHTPRTRTPDPRAYTMHTQTKTCAHKSRCTHTTPPLYTSAKVYIEYHPKKPLREYRDEGTGKMTCRA